jgi:hypothetical protein
VTPSSTKTGFSWVCGTGGFGAAALVNGDVHEDAAGAHETEHVAADETGRPCAGDEDSADEEVGAGEHLEEARFVGVEGVGAVEGDVEVAHALDVHFEDGDVSAEAGGHAGGVDAGGAAAEDDDFAGENAWNAAKECAAAAVVFGQIIAADEDAHAPGNFAHRLEQRETAIDFDGFVGDGGHAGAEEGVGEGAVGGEVEEGEEDLAGAEERQFGGLRLLDFDYQFRGIEDGGGGVHERSAGEGVFAVGEAGAFASAALDEDLMAAFGELPGGGRREGDTVFLIFDFFGDADDHFFRRGSTADQISRATASAGAVASRRRMRRGWAAAMAS